jgi:hypothetical protein
VRDGRRHGPARRANNVIIGLDAADKLDAGNFNAKINVGLDITSYII